MNTNNAPTTIFVNNLGYGCLDKPCIERMFASQIEYVRKDAFIKNVENFLEMLGCGFTITDNVTHTNYDKEQLIEDFKNYMKNIEI